MSQIYIEVENINSPEYQAPSIDIINILAREEACGIERAPFRDKVFQLFEIATLSSNAASKVGVHFTLGRFYSRVRSTGDTLLEIVEAM